MSKDQETRQFESVIKSSLNSWVVESDLEIEELVASAYRAIEDWMNEETVGFEPDEA